MDKEQVEDERLKNKFILLIEPYYEKLEHATENLPDDLEDRGLVQASLYFVLGIIQERRKSNEQMEKDWGDSKDEWLL